MSLLWLNWTSGVSWHYATLMSPFGSHPLSCHSLLGITESLDIQIQLSLGLRAQGELPGQTFSDLYPTFAQFSFSFFLKQYFFLNCDKTCISVQWH